ncbi:MAG TPA: class D sortase [Bryobacteraceae bacterium]|nr:class D sortase [Bryobacteraceae bacterium]
MPQIPQRSARFWRTASSWAERCLWWFGIVALGYAVLTWAEAAYEQAQGNRALDRMIRSGAARSNGPDGGAAEGSLVGRIEIPRVGLSSVIFEGSGDGTLQRGVGHLTSSPLPGKPGNVVLAGHRDSFFRPLRNIRAGDTIALTMPRKVFHYVVVSTDIVGPQQTEVLRPVPGTDLTLITCYPFGYLGSAPDRYIVRGRTME